MVSILDQNPIRRCLCRFLKGVRQCLANPKAARIGIVGALVVPANPAAGDHFFNDGRHECLVQRFSFEGGVPAAALSAGVQTEVSAYSERYFVELQPPSTTMV